MSLICIFSFSDFLTEVTFEDLPGSLKKKKKKTVKSDQPKFLYRSPQLLFILLLFMCKYSRRL